MNIKSHFFILTFLSLAISSQAQNFQGYFNFTFSDTTGKMLLNVEKLKTDFLMVNAFGTGIGSNDIGMDRGKLGDIRIVRFEKQGDKILLIQPNLNFRAISNNPLEVRAVQEAFATSVIWGFKNEDKTGAKIIIDIAPFLLDDQNQVVQTLKTQKQGTYKLEKTRSSIYLENTHSFPKNSEFESILTFVGEGAGNHIKSVSPTPESISFRQHVSFIELPDNNYKPRTFHPESGYFYMSYFDYATPIHSPIEKKFIYRHRLNKKDPKSKLSEPIEPIIYYIDPGCPDPIKSALVEGGKWWNDAFESAGFKNAFDVRELPAGAHPLDVRYNMIQWVHRSTRGWSYGSSISDPRTGEIIKGHVSLGSLRVRQDFMLAQGIASPFSKSDDNYDALTKMSLDRLRQLSAHEIGHTIGLAHNFASSVNDRASVMDYPHPFISLKDDGTIDFSKAYDHKIGEWDKRSIQYGYGEFANPIEEEKGLKDLIIKNHKDGFHFLTDEDARSLGSASPINHLWDNGKDPIAELDRILKLREAAMKNFGLNTIPNGTPVSELEKIFVPVYYMHRYQAEAVGKLIGGINYTYAVKGTSNLTPLSNVSIAIQNKATDALLGLMSEKYLKVPSQIESWMFPPAYGYGRTRESSPTNSNPSFDSYAVTESACGQVIDIMLHPDRLNRLVAQNQIYNYITSILKYVGENSAKDQVIQIAENTIITRLLGLSVSENLNHKIKAIITHALNEYSRDYIHKSYIDNMNNNNLAAHYQYLIQILSIPLEKRGEFKVNKPDALPPGSPIGCCSLHD